MKISKDILDAIKQAQEGKEEGFNKIYSATYNFVFFRSKMIMKNDSEAWDLLQEVYIVAYKSIAKLEKPDNLYAWLGGIAYNLGMKAYRKKQDVLLDEEGEGIFDDLKSFDIDTQPEEYVEQEQTSNIIKELIDGLPPLQKAAVIAYYFDEMSVSEIAETFECSTGTIKSRLNYARQYLKQAVEEKEKKDGIRLHSVTIPALLLALRMLSEETVVSAQVAQITYNGICTSIGLKAGTLVPIANGAGASISATTSSVASTAGMEAKATGLLAKFAVSSIGTKTAVIGLSAALGITSVAGVVMINKNSGDQAVVSIVDDNESEPNLEVTPIIDELSGEDITPTVIAESDNQVAPSFSEELAESNVQLSPIAEKKDYSKAYEAFKNFLINYDEHLTPIRYKDYESSEYFLFDWNDGKAPILITRDKYNKKPCDYYDVHYDESKNEVVVKLSNITPIRYNVLYKKDNSFIEVRDDLEDSAYYAWRFRTVDGMNSQKEELWFWYRRADGTTFNLDEDSYKAKREEVEGLEMIKWYPVDDLSLFEKISE